LEVGSQQVAAIVMISLKRIFILVAFIVALVAYTYAPADVTPGTYHATFYFQSPVNIERTENITIEFKLGDSCSSSWNIKTISFGEYNATVEYKEQYALSTGSVVEIRTYFMWRNGTKIKLPADVLRLEIRNSDDFEIILRPSRVLDHTYVFLYRPLVKSNVAFAILFLIVVLWFTEAIPLAASALIIPVLAVVFGISSATDALAPFFHPAVVLIIGGLLIGRALQKHNLDKRIALTILSKTKGSGSLLILMMMYTTAFLSFWISNTASAAIMLPIGLAVIAKFSNGGEGTNYSKVIVLSIAYSATIGGIATLIGTPPNPIAAGMLQEFLDIEFSFVDWLPFGLPYVIVFIPVAWKILTFIFKPEKELEKEVRSISDKSREELEKMGPMTREQKLVSIVFAITVALWFTQKVPDFIANATGFSGHGISSSIVALIGVGLLYMLGLMDEEDIRKINWSAVLIIGGGILLGNILITTGVSDWIAYQLIGLQGLHPLIINFLLGLLSLVITMFASNTAAASILVPIGIPLAISLGMSPVLVTITIAIAASLDFALPVGTPPSTLAYSTGKVKLKDMLRVGLILDIVSLILLTFGIVWVWVLLGLISF